LKLLEENGCNVDYDNNRVRFPPGLVEDSLHKCPSSFHVKARNPRNDVIIGGENFTVQTFPGMQTVDLDTWQPRTATRQEYYDGVTILDALENLHFMGNYVPYFGYESLPPVMCIPEGFAARARNSTKVLKCGNLDNSETFTMKIAEAVGADVMMTLHAQPPLTYPESSIEALYRGLAVDYPFGAQCAAVMGGTGPATIAGSLLTGNAEIIGGIVLAQIIKPGAKVAVYNFVQPQNMRSGGPIFGSIEHALSNIVFCQYFRRLGIPSGVIGPSSAKRVDFQCGYEKAVVGILAAACGANSCHFLGGIFGELTFHPVQAILDNDISGMIGRFLQGVQVDKETLALDLIDEVGPIPGHYLGAEHTRTWWKREAFMPMVADRVDLPEWIRSGKKSPVDYARERMEEILATHKPEPLTQKQEEDVEKILEEARQYYKGKDLM
jgi:trimethylamine--corrinoid protein Co-methyltransferase